MKKQGFVRFISGGFLVLFILIMPSACESEIKDDEVPAIDLGIENAFPQNCATVYRGEAFQFRFRLSDNIELGSYSIEMHHNFDHHTHSTSPVQCKRDPVKAAVKPFLFIQDFQIPVGLTEYIATGLIDVPADVDTGDYHFMIRVTDRSGWQTFEGIGIKIIERSVEI